MRKICSSTLALLGIPGKLWKVMRHVPPKGVPIELKFLNLKKADDFAIKLN